MKPGFHDVLHINFQTFPAPFSPPKKVADVIGLIGASFGSLIVRSSTRLAICMAMEGDVISTKHYIWLYIYIYPARYPTKKYPTRYISLRSWWFFDLRQCMYICLVLTGTMEFCDFPFSWECHHPNWRSHIFQRGRYTTNQKWFLGFSNLDKTQM